MLTRLSNARCIDYGGQANDSVRDLYIDSDSITSQVLPDRRVDVHYDLTDHVVMAGGIDLHTHIGGGKVNIARLLLPELKTQPILRSNDNAGGIRPLTSPVPGTIETGQRYVEMGYTTCFEPAVLPANARHAHAEMADTPWLDTGGYLLLGNERLLLGWLDRNVPQQQITDYVAWMLRAHQCCGVKVVNAGGIDAFKFNQRHLNVDEYHPHFRVTPRRILLALARAIEDLGLAHPLHVHCSNLGVPGNINSTLATIQAVEGRRLHLTHAQYHCYSTNGPHGFGSAANILADRVNSDSNLTIDVGQVLFGQTVTLSGDTMHQFANRKLASPRKTIFQDLECQAGCGVLPFRYRQDQYVHGLQWTIGLELFLRIHDPTRVFLTTDHPNGGPFTAYPHLIRLLMDYDYRMSIFERLHPDVQKSSPLPSLRRQYRLDEIAAMTRRGPANILGLHNRGRLTDGALADLVAYPMHSNPEVMFSRPSMVFKRGTLIYRDGKFVGNATKSTIVAETPVDPIMHQSLVELWPSCYGYTHNVSLIARDELCDESRNVESNKNRF